MLLRQRGEAVRCIYGWTGVCGVLSFNGAHLPKGVIPFAVFFNVCYALSNWELAEIMAERDVQVEHATLSCSVTKCAMLVADKTPRISEGTGCTRRIEVPD